LVKATQKIWRWRKPASIATSKLLLKTIAVTPAKRGEVWLVDLGKPKDDHEQRDYVRRDFSDR